MEIKYTPINNVELRVYKIFGVCYFQKLVFLLEKFIHRKDGKKNQNYHFTLSSINPMEHFVRFLFFNGSIHFRNICLFAIYCVIKKFYFSFYWYDAVFLVLFVKDIYCIMLQRYNYLRMIKANLQWERRRKKNINKRIDELLPVFQENYDISNVNQDLELIHRINVAIENKSVVFLNEEDEVILKRLMDVMKKTN